MSFALGTLSLWQLYVCMCIWSLQERLRLVIKDRIFWSLWDIGANSSQGMDGIRDVSR